MDKLSEYLKECQQKTFQWGVSDCGYFIAGWGKLNGYDASCFQWKNKEEAFTELAEVGGYEKAISKVMQKDSSFNCNYANTGDICLCKFADDYLAGIVSGRYAMLMHETKGLHAVPRKFISCYWRITNE